MSAVADRPHPVLVVGPVMHDVVTVVDGPFAYGSDAPARVVTRGGGAGGNVAAWLAASGATPTLVARVGHDPAGDAELATLERSGVRLRVARDPARATGTCVILVTESGERSMLPDQGANSALAPSDLPADEFRAGRHLHLSGYVLLDAGSRAAGLSALALARRAGMTVSVDPSSAAPLRDVGAEAFLGWTAGADLLLPNEDEARVLAGPGVTGDAAAPARALAPRYGAVVCTRGAHGALWAVAGSAPVSAPAAAGPVADTTGAGDAFTAGVLGAWLTGGTTEDALAEGCRLASRAVGTVGARPAP